MDSPILNFFNREHYQLYYIPVAKALKSIEGAILLSEFVQRYQYHQSRKELVEISNHGTGWFYHTREAIEERTAISRRQIDNAIRVLKKFNLIETINHGLPRRTYFRLKIDGIEEFSKNLSSCIAPIKLAASLVHNKDTRCEKTIPYREEPNKEPNKENMSEPTFRQCAYDFFNKLKKINPKIKTPNFHKWAKELELLSRDGDSTTVSQIEKVIDYVISTKDQPASNGFSWANVILSASSLRKNFPKLWGEMQTRNPEKLKTKQDDEIEISEKNKAWFTKIYKKIWEKRPANEIITQAAFFVGFQNDLDSNEFRIHYKDINFHILVKEELKKRKYDECMR